MAIETTPGPVPGRGAAPPAAGAVPAALPRCAVVICAWSLERWDDLRAAVTSASAQTLRPEQVVVAVDHNPELLRLVRREMPDVTAVPNDSAPGASGARNVGVAATAAPVVAFLDDDAVAAPDWLELLARHHGDPRVVGAGGKSLPRWAGDPPAWFPPEFLWAVGASYRGLPARARTVRNVWSGSMTVRRDAFEAVGGFRTGFGKVGNRSRPEDTEFCLRAASASGGRWIYEPASVMWHRVPAERATLRFFLERCYREGGGKAELGALAGRAAATSEERRYVRRVLPRGIALALAEALRGDPAGLARAAAIIAGLGAASAGDLAARAAALLRRPMAGPPAARG